MDDLEKTQKLVRLKRYEQPPEEYFDGFLKEFHQRQRAELMKRSSVSLFFERLGTYIGGFGRPQLMLAGAAAAAVALAVVVTSKPSVDPAQTAGTGPDFDAPQGKVQPVSSQVPVVAPKAGNDVDEAEETERFRMAPRPTAETQTFEL